MVIRFYFVVIAIAFSLAVGCSCSDDGTNMDGAVPDADTPVDGGRDAGDIDSGDIDAGPPPGRCGDSELNAGEECDDGNRDPDDFCNAMCQTSCGDGVVNAVEVCDTGIGAADPGACPASCDDSDACTSDVLSGVECLAECMHAPITACMNDDGCCPGGCTAVADNDCATTCGNMVLEPGELCEDGTATPCPATCNDMSSCTMDVRTGDAATCDAECSFLAITTCSATADGCCPMACNSSTDADCSASCGNMVFEPPAELCENGTATPCPTSCDDGVACTTNVLSGMASMCNVQCSYPAITACSLTGDGCCPGTCNAITDADCRPVCGNTVVEPPETCDDGNTTSGDGCDSMCRREAVPPTAFRLTDLDLRDPHAFARIVIFCTDITSNLNTELQTAITTDADMPADGILDLSFVVVFRPLMQSAMRGSLDLVDADCTAPAASTMCTLPAGSMPLASGMYTNQTTGNCLDTRVGGSSVVRPYSPAVTVPVAPCFVTDPQTIVVSLTGLSLTLYDAQIAATYLGSPATGLRNGLLRGFITQSDAEATVLPPALPIVGGSTLASVLRGGMGNCGSGSDMDTHATLGRGWWFFLNFPATRVPYSEP